MRVCSSLLAVFVVFDFPDHVQHPCLPLEESPEGSQGHVARLVAYGWRQAGAGVDALP